MTFGLESRCARIRFSGFGGQGVVLLGEILGHAAMLSGRRTAQSSAYGAEARGSTSSSEVVISDSWIVYPKVEEADILIVMSQNGYDQYASRLYPQGLVLFDASLVTPQKSERHYAILATKLAREELGNSIVANMIMLGAFAGITEIVSNEKLLEAVKAHVPPNYFQVNLRAVERGFELVRGFNLQVSC